MLELKDLKQTRVYQEAFEQGIEAQKLATIPLLKELGLTSKQIAKRLELPLETVRKYLEKQE